MPLINIKQVTPDLDFNDFDHRRTEVCSERKDMIETIKLLQEALRKAILWTDEENDVGNWRAEAESILTRTGAVL